VNDKPSRWEGVFFGYATSSFADVLRHSAPHLLPQGEEAPRETNRAPAVPHGTTVLALRYRDGVIMALDGKANKLGQMIRMNLPLAMQGLVVVPIFAGFDERAGVGRLFKYDVTGGRYEETDYFAQGSGGKDARDSLKKRFKRDLSKDEAVRVSIEALMDAADEDLGTGGPDLQRGIYPTVKTITRSGFGEVSDEEIRRYCEAILAERGRS